MILKTLNSMRKRMSWTDARVLLLKAGIEPGLGWNKTIEKIKQLPVQPDAGPLQDQVIEHILCGQKFTKLYPLNPKDRTALQAKLVDQKIPDIAAALSFPNHLTEDQLIEHPGGFSPVSVESDDDGIGLVFSSAFQMKKREDIPFEEFGHPDEIRARYDEIVGVTFQWEQIMSVIWVPHHRDNIELRIDYPKGMTQDAIHALHSQLRELVNSLGVVKLVKAINLFPAVRNFYDDKKEGRVTEIMFSTTTGGIKNEKIIKRRGQIDQRDETYHLAGKAGLDTEINLYRVTVEWSFTEDNLFFKPSILLAATGPSGKGPGGEPTISGAVIGGCVRAADYEFVIERLGQKVKLTA